MFDTLCTDKGRNSHLSVFYRNIMKEQEVKVELSGSDIRYSAKISPRLAAEFLRLSLLEASSSGNGSVMVGPAQLGTNSGFAGKKLAVQEYVRQTGAGTFPEKILAIGAYLADFERKENFSLEDVLPYFRQLGEVPPRNLPRDFKVAVANSWIAHDNTQPDAYWVTSTGRASLESKFEGGGRIRRVRRRMRSRSTRTRLPLSLKGE